MGDKNRRFGLKDFFYPSGIDYEMANPSPVVVVTYALSHISSFLYPLPLHTPPMFKKLQSLYEYNIQRCSLLPTAGEGKGG